jgi:hypothetical protein
LVHSAKLQNKYGWIIIIFLLILFKKIFKQFFSDRLDFIGYNFEVRIHILLFKSIVVAFDLSADGGSIGLQVFLKIKFNGFRDIYDEILLVFGMISYKLAYCYTKFFDKC